MAELASQENIATLAPWNGEGGSEQPGPRKNLP